MLMSEKVRLSLTLTIALFASAASAAEPELLADVPAARAAGYQIVDIRSRASEEHSDLVRQLVDDFARSQGVMRSVNAVWALIALPSDQEVLLVSPLGQEFDLPGNRGGRLLVYAVQGRGAELVLDTSAMRVGVDGHGQIAAIDEKGFRVLWLQKTP